MTDHLMLLEPFIPKQLKNKVMIKFNEVETDEN